MEVYWKIRPERLEFDVHGIIHQFLEICHRRTSSDEISEVYNYN